MVNPISNIASLRVAEAGDLLAMAARAFFERTRTHSPDLSRGLVLLPNLDAAAEFKSRLRQCANVPVLMLPRVTTFARLAQDAGVVANHDAARIVWLCGALRARKWFDDATRWSVSRELGSLFDELTANNLALPRNLEEFRRQLHAAYASGAMRGIDFEASLVNELWVALEGSGPPSPSALRKLALAHFAANATGPLVALSMDEPSPEMQAFCIAWAAQQPVAQVLFAPETAARTSVTGFLQAVWPPTPAASGGTPDDASLLARAAVLRSENAHSPVTGKLSLFGAANAEQEAWAAVLSIRGWLQGGAKYIAIVAQDRLVARRLRALLEREHILVKDEAGWRISTTSAATAVSRWLDVVSEGFHHRDLLDLLKSPFVLFDVEAIRRRELVHRLERIIRRHNVVEGLEAIVAAVARFDEASASDSDLRPLIARLHQAARAQLPSRDDGHVPLGAWLNRLREALEVLGVARGLEHDAAGRQLIDLLRTRAEALADDRQPFTFHEWRGWLNGEFETAEFVDAGIESPVVFTQLAGTRLQRFDKVLLLGADAAHLPGSPAPARFFNQRVRASLGLSTQDATNEILRRDLVALFVLAGEVRVSWQTQRDGEPNAASPLVEVLQAIHRHGFDDPLHAVELSAWLRETEPPAGDSSAEHPRRPPRPQAAALTPAGVSVSGYASLVNCPYQFFARHMLSLNEADEVEEQIAKSDFGEAVHRILNAFHRRVPMTGAMADDECLRLLGELSAREFAPLLARNPLAAAYQAEWNGMMENYLAWQRGREDEGWRFHAAEICHEHALQLSDGATLTLRGRLDRVDVNPAGGLAVMDYKMRAASQLRKGAAEPGEDVQLASYALLLQLGGTPPVEAGYIALERHAIIPVLFPGDPGEIAAHTAVRLDATFTAMRAGAELPAQGVATVCGFCEMRGLCRRDYWERE